MNRRGLPLVFVASIDGPQLADADEQHLRRALRLRDGDPFAVSDGQGHWCPVRLGPDAIEPDGETVFEPAPIDQLTVGFSPVKGERPEWFVQKLTELEIDRIIPLMSDRGVVRWDDKRAAKLAERFAVTVREAAMQSRRVWLPTVDAPMTVEAARALEGAALTDPDGRAPAVNDRFFLVGPEGGWSEKERHGADAVRLPGAVLRAETAAVAAAVVLGTQRAARK